jgi:hypothetical protein
MTAGILAWPVIARSRQGEARREQGGDRVSTPTVHDALTRWAAHEFRSLNGHVEMLLRRALNEAGPDGPDKPGPMPKRGRPPNRGGRQGDGAATRFSGGRPTTRRRAAPVDTPGRGRPTFVTVLGRAAPKSHRGIDHRTLGRPCICRSARSGQSAMRAGTLRNRRRRDLHSHRDGHPWNTERFPPLRGQEGVRGSGADRDVRAGRRVALSARTRALGRVAAEYLAHTEVVWLPGVCAATGEGRALRVRRSVRADDEFSSGVSFSLVPQRIGHVAQCVAPLEDRGNLAGFDKLLQNRQVLSVVPHDEHTHPLAHERR